MVTLHRANVWKIAVYGGDHGIPHFHIEGRTFRCSVTIETRELIVGSAPPAILRSTRDWADHNLEALRTAWKALNG